MTVKELREQLDKYPDDLIIEIGFNPTQFDPLETNIHKRIIIPEPALKYEVKYDDRGYKAFEFLRIF